VNKLEIIFTMKSFTVYRDDSTTTKEPTSHKPAPFGDITNRLLPIGPTLAKKRKEKVRSDLGNDQGEERIQGTIDVL
jgi:hypothetical protein